MRIKTTFIVIVGGALAGITTPVIAVPDMRVTVQGSNAVITWPSTEEQTYYVRHRATLHTNTSWVFLTNGMAAAEGTNRTSFIHAGAVLYPPPAAGGGGGTAEGPPPPGGSSMAASSSSFDVGIPMWDRWMYEGRLPYLHELEKRPPYPWDPDVWAMKMERQLTSADSSTMQSSSTEGSGSGLNTTMGFYSVEPAAGARILLTNGTVLSNIVSIPIVVYATGTNKVVSSSCST